MAALCCPACGEYENGIVDSRPWNGTVRRSRKCKRCQTRWVTIEVSADFMDHLPAFYERVVQMGTELLAFGTKHRGLPPRELEQTEGQRNDDATHMED